MSRKTDDLKARTKTAAAKAKPRTIEPDVREQVAEATKPEPRFADNILELMPHIGIGRTTFWKWQQKHADFPKPRGNGQWEIAVVRDWIAKKGLAPGTDDEMTEKEALEVRRLTALCEGLEFKNACERREYLPKDEVRRQVAEATHVLRRALGSLRGSLAPKVAGLSVESAAVVIRDETEAIQSQLHEGAWEVLGA